MGVGVLLGAGVLLGVHDGARLTGSSVISVIKVPAGVGEGVPNGNCVMFNSATLKEGAGVFETPGVGVPFALVETSSATPKPITKKPRMATVINGIDIRNPA